MEPRRADGFAALDGMRGIAALLIAVRHTDALFQPVGFPESFLAVDLFFALSGAVLLHAYGHRLAAGMSAGRFMWLRLVRIYPMYVLGTGLELALLLWDGQAPGWREVALAAVLLPDLVGTMTYPLNGPAWSLFLELAINLVFAAGLRWLGTGRLLVAMAASAVLLCVLVGVGQRHTLDVGWTARSFLAGFPRVVFSFFAGMVAYRVFLRWGGGAWRSGWASWGLVAGVGGLLTLHPGPGWAPEYELAAALLVFPVLVLLGLRCRPDGGTARVFRLAGALSYPVYATHVAFGHLVRDGVELATGRPASSFAPWIGVMFLVGLGLACRGLELGYDEKVRRWLAGGGRGRPVRRVGAEG